MKFSFYIFCELETICSNLESEFLLENCIYVSICFQFGWDERWKNNSALFLTDDSEVKRLSVDFC